MQHDMFKFAPLLGDVFECAVSSGVEHHLDTVGVTGSNPVSRTILQFLTLTSLLSVSPS